MDKEDYYTYFYALPFHCSPDVLFPLFFPELSENKAGEENFTEKKNQIDLEERKERKREEKKDGRKADEGV